MNAIDAILNDAELDPALQAYIAAHFKPSPVPLSAIYGFSDLEAAQLLYAIQPCDRPHLAERFTVDLLVMRPFLADQRRRPN